MKGPKVRVDELEVTGEKLVATIRELVHQGNVRRVVIRNAKGVTLLEIPLVVGIAGAVLVPVWAAVGALAALLARLTLVVEREEETPAAPPPPPPAPSASGPGKAKTPPKAPRRKAPPRA